MKKRTKEIPYGIRIARNKYSLITSKERDRKNAYHDLKEKLQFPDLCESVDYLDRKMNKRWQELLWGKSLPQDYSELGDLKELPYLGHNINAELNFLLVTIRKYKYKINLFLNYKNEYEQLLLTSRYERAELILDKIEKEICFSLWTLENRFLLKEMSGNAPENKEFLNFFNQVNNSDSITNSLAHYLSLRAEHSLSVNRYSNDLENALENIPFGKNRQAFQSYYRFRLTFLNHIDFNNYAEILSIDFNHSVIDRYLHLIKVLSNILVVSTYLKDKDSVETNKGSIKKYILNRINYLIKKVNDPTLYKLKLLAGDKIFPAFDVEKSHTQIRIIDKYTIGLYNDVEKEITPLLINNPTQFDLYLIYIKALVYQKKYFIPVGKKGSILNQILLNLYKIISVEGNRDQAGHDLLRIANNLTSCILSYGITDFVLFQTSGKEERKMLSKLSYNFSNPLIYEVFESSIDKMNFLNLLEKKFPDSITIKFFTEKTKGINDLVKFKKFLPEAKFKVEYARKLQEKGDYLGAIEEWQYLKRNYKNMVPILETTIVNLYECYQKLNRINDAIKLYVDSFFFNNYIVEKIETNKLLNLIHSAKFRNVEKTIDLPLFYTIVDADEVEAHIAFELFNISNGVDNPSELIEKASEFNDHKFIFFINNCCRSKILMHSPYIENSKHRLEERLILLNYVKSVSSSDNNVIDEIKSIENILIIQQGLIDLDESKIYVNEEGIINNELQDFEAVYERFEIISGITGEKKPFLYLEGGKLTTFVTKENTQYEKIEYSNNPVFEIYYELFEAVRDKFLNSQFGIVAYLSTRIRHGVLVGELRPIFETHKLITLKQGNSSSYRRNNHWDRIYSHFNKDLKEQIQYQLSNFSSKVDGLIFDMIKKYLQVYKEEINEDGWFDYDFDKVDDLWIHSIDAINSKNFDDFVDKIFKILWQRTDENLELIRGKIENEILEEFNDYFNELESNIIDQFGSLNCQELIQAIKNCSTEIQTVMTKISRWFKRSEIKATDFILSDLIKLVSEHINRSNLNKTLMISEETIFNPKIKGKYKTHLADLLRIFLENILKHSGDNHKNIKCKIESKALEENELYLSVQNEITSKDSIEAMKAIWKKTQMDVKKLVSEGKSGYHKAYKILTSDLKSDPKNCLSTALSDNEEWFEVSVNINLIEIGV